MTLDNYRICQTQARLYEYAARKGFDMQWFSTEYLSSDFCRRAFDTIYSRFQTADEQECLDFILPELGTLKMLDDKEEYMFNPDIAYWMGFTYRQLYIETGLPSKDLVKKINFETMCQYYPGLHTIDEEMATDIICTDFNLNKIEESNTKNEIEF